MRASLPIVACLLCVQGCSSAAPKEHDLPQSREAELSMKDEKIALLEKLIDKQHVLIEGLLRKEKADGGADAAARDGRIEELQKQVEMVKVQMANKNELLVHLYNELVNRLQQLQGTVKELEKRLGEEEKK